jgi:hypothetical protein
LRAICLWVSSAEVIYRKRKKRRREKTPLEEDYP